METETAFKQSRSLIIIKAFRIDSAIGGARHNEEKVRAKEIFFFIP